MKRHTGEAEALGVNNMTFEFTPDEIDLMASKALQLHRDSYYNWIRQIVTLSFGSLTLLVLLQNTYIGPSPKLIWLLLTSWALFAVTVLSGLLALYGESCGRLEIANVLKSVSATIRRTKSDYSSGGVYKMRPIFAVSYHVTIFCFLAAIVCMTLFASINLPLP
jgi:hypothetical protein